MVRAAHRDGQDGPRCPLRCGRCGSPPSASPTGGRRPTRRRTRSRRSPWPCGSGPRAWRATRGARPTARWCWTTTGSSAPGCAGARSPRCPAPHCLRPCPRWATSTTLAGPTSSCPSTSGTRRRPRPSCRWPGTRAERPWGGSGSARPTGRWPPRGAPLDPDVRLVDSTRLRRIKEGAERRAARLAEAGVDAINLHWSDWTGGLTTLFHRFERFTLGWDAQHRRQLDEVLSLGIDGVFSDHVDRMVDALQERQVG